MMRLTARLPRVDSLRRIALCANRIDQRGYRFLASTQRRAEYDIADANSAGTLGAKKGNNLLRLYYSRGMCN